MKKSLLTTLALAGIISVNAQTSLYTENFEGTTGTGVPTGWTNVTSATDGGWLSGTPTGNYPAGLSSSYFPVPALTGSTRSLGTNDDGCNCNKSNEMISSPVINCSGQATVFLSFDCFYAEGSYNGASEEMKVRVSNNGGSTWTDVATVTGAADWNNKVYDISAVAGNQSNVKIAFWYDDGSDWLFGAVVDNINVYAPAARDVEGLTLNMYMYTGNGTPYTVSGTMKNLGGSAISSMDLNYKVDNGAVVTQNLSGLNVAPLANYNFSHGTPWTPSSTGNHTIKVWASNINGGADANNANDTITYSTNTCSQIVQRISLFEGFSSSTCGPCASANPITHALLAANNYNTPSGKVAVVKYQMDYPTVGDPCYTTENDTRHTFYGVNGIPHGELNGGNDFTGHPAGLTQQHIDDAYAVPSPIAITGSAIYSGNVITVTGSVNAYTAISGAKLLIALTEDHITDADGGHGVQSNGETEWFAVNRKFGAGTNGTTLGNMVDGGSYPFNVATTFTGYTGPGTGTAGNSGNKIFTSINQMTAVVWVQNLTTKVIYQAGVMDVTTSVDDAASTLSTLDMYPNPSTDNANVKFTLKNNNNVVINVYNMLGEVVYSQNYGTMTAGVNTVNFGTSNFANGMYSVVITAGEYNTTARLMIQK